MLQNGRRNSIGLLNCSMASPSALASHPDLAVVNASKSMLALVLLFLCLTLSSPFRLPAPPVSPCLTVVLLDDPDSLSTHLPAHIRVSVLWAYPVIYSTSIPFLLALSLLFPIFLVIYSRVLTLPATAKLSHFPPACKGSTNEMAPNDCVPCFAFFSEPGSDFFLSSTERDSLIAHCAAIVRVSCQSLPSDSWSYKHTFLRPMCHMLCYFVLVPYYCRVVTLPHCKISSWAIQPNFSHTA